ncbi:MAG: hypothetical protein RL007_464 [Bacteroidota bacterium]|jgi:hypothetical protein
MKRDLRFNYYLCGITLAGFLLRINHTWSESITADEVSALLRLQFDSFSEMLQNGVKPDGHPAFTQVLLWFWIKIFGDSEFAVRLPFVLMGTASIWFGAQAARKWFGAASGLATAAALAFLQFPIMYSQLARPYAPGLFFTMLAAYFVARFSEERKASWKHVAGFAIAGAGAAYSHYFSLYTTLLLGVAGLFLVTKVNRKLYLFSAVGAVMIFLPHITFTLSQLAIGGVGGPGGWLGPPTSDFFGAHFFYVFNSSLGLMIVVLFFAVVGLFFNFRRTGKRQIAMFFLWVIPLLTGYFYSIYVNPVLQHSVLLFSFPFLIMLFFSWLPYDENSIWSYRFAIVMMIPMLWYITAHKPFRLTDHFGRLKEIVEVYERTESEFGNEKVDVMFNVDDPYFIDYYRKRKRKINVADDHYLRFDGKELLQLREAVQNSTADYFVYGWSTRESYPAAEDIIREKFPCLIEEHEWFNSAVYVFAKLADESEDNDFRLSVVGNYECIFSKGDTGLYKWPEPCRKVYYSDSILNNTELLFSFLMQNNSNCFMQLDSSCQFGPVLKVCVSDGIVNPDNLIGLSAAIQLENPESEVIAVVEYYREGERLLWTGGSSKHQLDSSDRGWQNLYFVQRPAVELLKTDSIHAYLYTPNLTPVRVHNVRFFTRDGHRGIYGNRPDYQ